MTAEWLQYGSFGLLAVVLVAIGVHLRDREKRETGARVDNEAFIRDLVKHSLDSMDAGVAVQKSVAEAMVRLVEQIEAHNGAMTLAAAEIKHNQELIMAAVQQAQVKIARAKTAIK